jgi:hypothetical protein
MATSKIFKRNQTPEFRTTSVSLDLTPEEAYALVMVLEEVGGSPTTSPRKFIKEIYSALNCVIKSPYSWEDRFKVVQSNVSFFYFKDDTLKDFIEKALISDNNSN